MLRDLNLSKWRGYAPWDDQIMIRRQTPGQETISLETFAKYVAGKVMKFMQVILFHFPKNSG
jgi:hypothetical protein